MIGVTMMDANAFISAYRGHEHRLNRQVEYRRQAEENGSIKHRSVERKETARRS